MDFFDFSGIVPALPGLWNGMVMTLKLMVLGVIGGVALGTVLALMRLSSSKWLANLAGAYVNYFRSIPLLLVITWFYLAVPFVLRWITGKDTPIGAFESCMVAFVMFEAAYFCEIFRAGIQAIPAGQYEAAHTLGMNYVQTMRRIILPQVIRIILPPISNETITLVKDTSLVYVLAMNDLMRTARNLVQRDFSITPFIVAAVFYLLATLILTLVFERLEKRFSRYDQ